MAKPTAAEAETAGKIKENAAAVMREVADAVRVIVAHAPYIAAAAATVEAAALAVKHMERERDDARTERDKAVKANKSLVDRIAEFEAKAPK